jgi:hypothetical protein
MDCQHQVLSGSTLEKKWTLVLGPTGVECSSCGEQWVRKNRSDVVAENAGGYGSHNPPNWVPNVDPYRGY